MTHESTDRWLTSKDLVAFLSTRRDNDVKVHVNGILVPIGGIHYHEIADSIVIELFRGADYRQALMPDPVPEVGT